MKLRERRLPVATCTARRLRRRYRPPCTELRFIAPCFGGADLTTMFVTSTAPDEDFPTREGDATFDGDVGRFRVDLPGLVEPVVRLPLGG